MKQLPSLLLVLALLLACLALPVAAVFGTGVRTLAEDEAMIKTTLQGQKITFSDADFKRAFGTENFRSITIRSLPKSTEGTLMFGGRRVGVGQTVKRRDLGALVFIPTSKNVSECNFLFTSDRIFGGKEIQCVLKFIDKVNYAPEVKSDPTPLAAWTQSGIALYTDLSGFDPEGDATVVMILDYPDHGTLTPTGNGIYRYESEDDYVGEDTFRYCLRDEYGNYSALRTVSLTVAEPRSGVRYADMTDDPAHNAAVALSGAGILSGTLLGDHHLFHPDETVTRGEFVAMAMKRAGIVADTTLTSTYFDDNDAIPSSLVSYIATAARMGIVNGSMEGGSLLFRPTDAITPIECAMILYNIYSLDAGDAAVAACPDDVPIWARAGVGAMFTSHLFDEGRSLTGAMTRRETATLLFRLEGLETK